MLTPAPIKQSFKTEQFWTEHPLSLKENNLS